ncbi:MAG: amino acid permease [Blastocatellia bacterium]|nr:amino acid permease [Blastocatellia bacterium]
MTAAPESLRRDLTRTGIALLVVNGIIGAGIFGLPSEAARLVGTFSPWLFVICGIIMATVMLSFAQAASYFDATGGPILYTWTAFGPFIGFQTGWILYVGRATSIAANVNLLATYLGSLIPGADVGPGRLTVIVLTVVVFTWINFVGVKSSVGAIAAITIVKLAPLAVLVLVGITWIRGDAVVPEGLPGYANFGEAMLLVVYAFIGFEGALIPAGETRHPERSIPIALLATGLITTVFYVLVQSVVASVLPDLGTSKRPLADAAGVIFGTVGVLVITATAAVSILGNTAASMLTAPRMTYTMARYGTLPTPLARVHDRYLTPHLSILLYGALSLGLALSGTFAWLAGMSSLARILGYILCIASLPRLKARFGDRPGALRLPGGMTIPVIALLVCAWLVMQTKLDAVLVTAGFIGGGILLYGFSKRGGRTEPAEHADAST